MKIFFATTLAFTQLISNVTGRERIYELNLVQSAAADNLAVAFSREANLVPEILTHGCWCSRLSSEENTSGNYDGVPVDDIDRMCRDWFKARRCLLLPSNSTSGVEDQLCTRLEIQNYDYSRDGNDCTDDPEVSACSFAACTIDRFYSRSLRQLALENAFTERTLKLDRGCRGPGAQVEEPCIDFNLDDYAPKCLENELCMTCSFSDPTVCTSCNTGSYYDTASMTCLPQQCLEVEYSGAVNSQAGVSVQWIAYDAEGEEISSIRMYSWPSWTWCFDSDDATVASITAQSTNAAGVTANGGMSINDGYGILPPILYNGGDSWVFYHRRSDVKYYPDIIWLDGNTDDRSVDGYSQGCRDATLCHFDRFSTDTSSEEYQYLQSRLSPTYPLDETYNGFGGFIKDLPEYMYCPENTSTRDGSCT